VHCINEPVIRAQEVEWAIQLYDVGAKQHVVAHGEVEPFELAHHRPGTQQRARHHPTRDHDVLGRVQQVEGRCRLPLCFLKGYCK